MGQRTEARQIRASPVRQRTGASDGKALFLLSPLGADLTSNAPQPAVSAAPPITVLSIVPLIYDLCAESAMKD